MSKDSPAPSPGSDEVPYVEIQAARRYILGLPLVVAVTLDNRSPETTYNLMPPLDLTFARGAKLSISLAPAGGGKPLVFRFPKVEESDPVVLLGPGEKRAMVFDPSNLGLAIPPGRYALTVSISAGGSSRTSNAVQTELVAPAEADAREIQRLRRLGHAGTDTGAWAPFLEDNWNTVVVAPTLDAEARNQLALHLFLHRAFYGPDKVAALDTAPLDAIRDRHLAAEVGTLKYEVLKARNDPRSKVARDVLLKNSPGSKYRVEAVDRGDGTLASGRKAFGPEQSFIRAPTSWPYKP